MLKDGRLLPRWARSVTVRTVVLTVAVSTILQVAWRLFLANDGGDLAAQDFWATAAHRFPGSAYNFAWYGGMHMPSYSVGSPYLMAWIGVRTTLMLADIVASGLTALLIAGTGRVRRPWIASLVGALAWTGNTISGRATFGLGMMFALASVAVVYLWPARRRGRDLLHSKGRLATLVVFSVLATFGSPVAGFFLGLLAAGLWLTADDFAPGTSLRERLRTTLRRLFVRRRQAAYSLGVPPTVVVLVSALLFPFSGIQPMNWSSVILPILMGLFLWLVAPPDWRALRCTALVYVVAVVLAALIRTEIGSNVTRLGLIFGGVALVAALCSGEARNPLRFLAFLPRWVPAQLFIVCAILTSLIWQTLQATNDAIHSRPALAFTTDTHSIVDELEDHHANLGRVEVVPSRSHVESSVLAPYFTLARGWNRQADVKRNPLFYNAAMPLTAAEYRSWLDRWAVSYVVVPPGAIDPASQAEADLIARGLSYLKPVWSDANWQLYRVVDPTPLVSAPGTLLKIDEAHMRIRVARAGRVRIRMLYSPWLGLVHGNGHLIKAPRVSAAGVVENKHGCVLPDPTVAPGQPLTSSGQPEVDVWTELWVPAPGIYTLAAPYSSRPGTACPEPDSGG
jgi:hypothetical protein